MTHRAAAGFWQAYGKLPENVRRIADKNFQILLENPRHPSLQLKKTGELWSARVGSHWRALALETDDGLVWIWIGTHSDYDKLIG